MERLDGELLLELESLLLEGAVLLLEVELLRAQLVELHLRLEAQLGQVDARLLAWLDARLLAQPLDLLAQVLQLPVAQVALLRHALDVGLALLDDRLAPLRLRHRLAQPVHARLIPAEGGGRRR